MNSSEALDVQTHTANVRAFMHATYEQFGLGDDTYQALVAKQVNTSLLNEMYPYDAKLVVDTLKTHAQQWFLRRSRKDMLLHFRTVNRFGLAILELQRYMPSIWFSDFMANPSATQSADFVKYVHVTSTLTDIFNIRDNNKTVLNPYTVELLCDMFTAAMTLAQGRGLDTYEHRQVRKNSKALTNDGFDAALIEFFKAIHKLFDFTESDQKRVEVPA